jgi:putative ABC transport system ATP-binding protein
MTVRFTDTRFTYPHGDFRLFVRDLRISKGERLAVIGPSGSGKTTLLNLIAGIYQPDSGRVIVDDTEISELNDAGRRRFRITRIGFVFQDFELLEYLTVMDNILHPYRVTGALRLSNDVRERAGKLASKMGIFDKLQRHAADLSQGEKQRAAICRALLHQPDLVLADEATGNLDPENKFRIMNLLHEIVEEHASTLIAVTHDHELLPRFDRVIDFAEFSGGSPS